MTALEEVQGVIGRVAERVGPSIVGLGRGWGTGSGVVIAEGLVLTSAHNLRGEEAGLSFPDGRRQRARIAGLDHDLDLAVLAADTGEAPAVGWPDREPQVALGSPVLALADPGGRGLRVTLGYVSSTPRSFRGPSGRRMGGGIEHNAPLPRGSSGGPLVDPEGGLLGLNTLRLGAGLILAVGAGGDLRERVEALARGEGPTRPRLGVAVAPARVARRMRRAVGLPEREGALVRAVEEGSPAARCGIARGDLLVAAGGRPVEEADDLHAALEALGPEESLTVTLLRGTEEREVVVTFAEARRA